MELVITAILIFILIFIGLIFWTQSKRKKISTSDQQRIKKHWELVMTQLSHNPNGAILEADKILDEGLKIKGYNGSLGEKLKAASPLFSNLNEVWAAHKLRNRLAHELNYKMIETEAKNALKSFKKALTDLGFNL